MKLHELAPPEGVDRKRKRSVGRGIAGKGGKTAGRGTKGQKARTQIPARLRGRPAAAPRSAPQAARGSPTPSASPTRPVNLDALGALGRRPRSTPTCWSRTASPSKGDLVKVLGRGDPDRRAVQRLGARLLGPARARPSRPPAARSSCSTCRSSVRPPASRQPAPEPLGPPCSPAREHLPGHPTFATRSCSRSAIICLYQARREHPDPRGQLDARSSCSRPRPGASGVLGFLNLFSGGALTRLAVFGLGVMPYITSSIVIQLLTTVIPKLTRVARPGRRRPEEDHPDDALPDHRPRAAAVDRAHLRLPRPRLGAARLQHRPDPQVHPLARALHGARS